MCALPMVASNITALSVSVVIKEPVLINALVVVESVIIAVSIEDRRILADEIKALFKLAVSLTFNKPVDILVSTKF